MALRGGGGGGLGVVVAAEIALVEGTDLVAGMLAWPWEQASAVLTRYVERAESAPDEVSASSRLLQIPPLPEIPEAFRGRRLVVIDGGILGTEEGAAEILAPLRRLEPELGTFGAVPPPALMRLHMDPEPPTPGLGDGMMVGALGAAAVDRIVGIAGPGSGSPLLAVELRQLGGALARRVPGAGALGSLQGSFAFYAVGVPMRPGMAEAIERRITALKDALAPWDSGRTYLNFAERRVGMADAVGADACARPERIKALVDPNGVFRAAHRLEPGTSTAAALAA